MKINGETLPSMAVRDVFSSIFRQFSQAILGEARLLPQISRPRVFEAHGAWRNDLQRVGGNEPKLGEGLDHFKQCGHLAFWLRRMSPVIDATDLTKNISDSDGYPLSSDELALRDLLFGYLNEFIAFEIGYQICLFYERAKDGGKHASLSLIPDDDYYRTVCHFLKYKSVSPHSLFFIYKSLFYNR